MPNEIEAKFIVTGEALAEQLRTVTSIDGLVLSPGITSRVRDTYLDTRDRRLLAAGQSCRRRATERGSGILLTVKTIGNGTAAIHDREEPEITVEKDLPPRRARQWA